MTYINRTSPISLQKNSASCTIQDDQAFLANRTKANALGNSTKSHFLRGFVALSIAIDADVDVTAPIAVYGLKPSISANARIQGTAINARLGAQSVCALYSVVNQPSSIKAAINDTGDVCQVGQFCLWHIVSK